MGQQNSETLQKKNRRIALIIFIIVTAMGGLSFASVPLYSLFCRVTGYGGTTQVSQTLPDKVLDRKVIVRFDANTADSLPWAFRPEIREVEVNLGERKLANFIARNEDSKPVAGTALFNVTPLKAGKYFDKMQCFCFNEQILQPGQQVHMPVLFYVDPKMNDDPQMDDVTVITLSYSFFKTDSPELDKALEEFYNSGQEEPSGQSF